MSNTINKIQSDKIKDTCECTYFQGITKKYKTDICKSCMHKQGKSFVKKEQEKRQEESRHLKLYLQAKQEATTEYLAAMKEYYKPEIKPFIKKKWYELFFE